LLSQTKVPYDDRIHTYIEKTQNLVKTIILLVSVVFGGAEVSNMGRYFSLAAYGEGLSTSYMVFVPLWAGSIK